VKARAMFEKAIELDPKYADAYVSVGWTYFLDASNGWMEPSMAFPALGTQGTATFSDITQGVSSIQRTNLRGPLPCCQ
jgi:hypothetical protein